MSSEVQKDTTSEEETSSQLVGRVGLSCRNGIQASERAYEYFYKVSNRAKIETRVTYLYVAYYNL